MPTLLSINYSAPYLHRGQAQTLEEVFPLHGLGPNGQIFPPMTTIASELTAQQQADLLVFLKSIDGTTVPFRSEADDFRWRIAASAPAASAGGNEVVKMKPGAWLRRKSASAAEPAT